MNTKVRTVRPSAQLDRTTVGSLLDRSARKLEEDVAAPEEGNNPLCTTDALFHINKFRTFPAITVVVADSYPLLVRGIAAALEVEENIHVVAQATNGNDALKIISESNPDVAVLDLQLPGKNGLEVIAALQEMKSATRPVLIASDITEEQFLRAKQLGMRGLVLKTMPPPLLVQCVRVVHAGEEFLEKGVFLKAFAKLLRNSNAKKDISQVLTQREFGVMELAAKGLSNKQVARELGITEGTVKVHLHQVYEKLRLRGRMHLLQYSREADLI